jgi:hypothetical protein
VSRRRTAVGTALGGLLGAVCFTTGTTALVALPAAVAGVVAGAGPDGDAAVDGTCAALGSGVVAPTLAGVAWLLATTGVALAGHEPVLARAVATGLPLVVWLPALLPVGYLAGHGAGRASRTVADRRRRA